MSGPYRTSSSRRLYPRTRWYRVVRKLVTLSPVGRLVRNVDWSTVVSFSVLAVAVSGFIWFMGHMALVVEPEREARRATKRAAEEERHDKLCSEICSRRQAQVFQSHVTYKMGSFRHQCRCLSKDGELSDASWGE